MLPGPLNLGSLLLVAAALGIVIWILRTYLREVAQMPSRVALSFRPARLVQIGPYTWSRHPMYLAEILSWLGIAAYFGNPILLTAIFTGMLLIGPIVIASEERSLESYFGDDYRQYRRRVPQFTDFKPHPPPRNE